MRTERFCPACRGALETDAGACPHCARTLAGADPATPRFARTPVASATPLDEGPTGLPRALAERYEVMGVLGRGGMGVVFRARDQRLGREVALKLLRETTPEMVEMFEREARTLAALEHDHVVRLYDFGVSGETPYLVMEYVRGASLSIRLAGGRPTVSEAARTARDVLRGVLAAHRHGIVHRDLKPGNVFMEESGRAKVADFGLARSTAAPLDAAVHGIEGTPGYMAPEQARDGRVGPPADVYAWGVLFHEMLIGRRLFTGADLLELFARQAAGAPPPPSATNPGVPRALDELVTRCLDPDPARRPGGEEALATLEGWLDGTRGRPRAVAGDLPAAPYKFLAHFDVADAPIFFGRDAEVLELANLIESEGTRLALVFGPCGVGKSSLLRAGVVPRLDPARFAPVVLAPGPDAARQIRAALCARAGVSEDENDPRPLVDVVARIASTTARTPVLVLDQMEEVFTQNPRGSPRVAELFRLVELLVEAERVPCRVVLSYRTEFRGDFFPLEERLGRLARTLAVREAGREALVDAIRGPSLIPQYRFAFADGLPEQLATDILAGEREHGDKLLPVLQIVCRQLYERMRSKGLDRIDGALYAGALGGTRGALERYVEDRLASPAYAYRGGMARQMLKALTVKEETGERFSRASDEEDLLSFPDRDGARRTLERLISDHLVARDAAPDGTRRVRLASEVICALVDAWVVEPDEAERAARTLGRAARQWEEQGRRDDDLLAGRALTLVERHLGALQSVSEHERAFLARSRAHRRSRRAILATVATALALLTGGLTWAAFLRPGTLALETYPPGAEARVDGHLIGRTPLRWPARPGRYLVSLEKPRHGSMQLEVRIPAGGEATYQPILPYPFGMLSVDSVPSGAVCTMRAPGGQVYATLRTPFTTEVPAGAIDVELSARGHVTDLIREVPIAPNREHRSISRRLLKDSGAFRVKTAWAGTDLTLLEESTGRRAFSAVLPMREPVELPVGRYRARMAGPQHRAEERSVRVTLGTTTTISAWLPLVQPLWVHPMAADGRPMLGNEPGPVSPDAVAGVALAELDDVKGLDVIAGHLAKRVVALSGRGGRALWSATTPAPVAAAPALARRDGAKPAVIAACLDGTVLALDPADGKPLWSVSIGGSTRVAPVCAPLDADRTEDAVIGAEDGSVRALSGATGAALWTVKPGAQPVRSTAALADVNGDGASDAILGDDGGAVRCLSGKDGATLWTYEAKAPVRTPPLVEDLDGKPGLEVAVGSADRRVHALSAKDGAVLWRREVGGELRGPFAALDVKGDGGADVIVPALDRQLYALSGDAGWPLWIAPMRAPAIGGVALARVDRDAIPDIASGSPDGVLSIHSGRDGRLIREQPGVGLPALGAPAIADLDGTGAPELVMRGPSDLTFAISLHLEEIDWSCLFLENANPGEVRPPWCVLADLDGDPEPDAVIGAGDGRLIGVRGRDGTEAFERRIAGTMPVPAATADLDGDGRTETLVGTVEGQLTCVDPRGAIAWTLPLGRVAGVPPAVARLDGDEVPDILLALRGELRALSGKTRKTLWSCDLKDALPTTCVPGDVDRDGTDDVAITTLANQVMAFSGKDGRPLWSAQQRGLLQVSPRLPDVDGDGDADVAAVTPDGRVTAFAGADGRVLWEARTGTSRSRPSAGDVDGDGAEDVIVPTVDGPVHVLSGKTGASHFVADAKIEIGDTLTGDLDGDGQLDVLAIALAAKVIGYSGRHREPLFTVDGFFTGSIGSALVDRAAFAKHGRALWSAGRSVLPHGPAPDLRLIALRMNTTLVASRYPWPFTRDGWGAAAHLTDRQRRHVTFR